MRNSLTRRLDTCRFKLKTAVPKTASRVIKAWLEMPVEEDDGKGGKRRTNRTRRERKGTPQGSPISPLLSERSDNRGYGNLMIMGT